MNVTKRRAVGLFHLAMGTWAVGCLVTFCIVVRSGFRVDPDALTGAQTFSPRFENSSYFDSTLPYSDRAEGIAYFVQVASSNWKLLERLLDSTYHPGNVYAVHFDSKMNQAEVKQAMASLDKYVSRPNFVVMEHREDVRWGRMSILLNLLSGLSQLLEFRGNWTHSVFLAPTNYPLVNQDDMRDILADYADHSFASGTPVGLDEKAWKTRCTLFVDSAIFNQSSTIRQSHKPPWLTIAASEIWKGSLWNILSKRDCLYLTQSPTVLRMLVRYQALIAPEEFFFINALASRPDSRNTETSSLKDNLHHVVWWHETKKNRDPSHPHILNSADFFFARLQSSGALFARKFDHSPGGLEFLDIIDEKLHGNKTYVAAVRRRITEACVVSTEGCLSRQYK